MIQRQGVTVTNLPGTVDHRWHGVVNRYGPQTGWCRCAVRFGQMKRPVMPSNAAADRVDVDTEPFGDLGEVNNSRSWLLTSAILSRAPDATSQLLRSSTDNN